MLKTMTALALSIAFTVNAQATPRHYSRVVYSYDEGTFIPHPAGCKWNSFCGCGASVRVFGRPVKELFLAANWGRFPSASCGPGRAAWRYGHVFVIESCNGDGTALATDYNSGGRLSRRHVVNLHGYRIVDPNGNLAMTHQRHRRLASR